MQDQFVESEETLRESGSRGDGLYRQRVSALADLSVAERNLFGDQFRGMSRACGYTSAPFVPEICQNRINCCSVSPIVDNLFYICALKPKNNNQN
jgi:hypothetical protein